MKNSAMILSYHDMPTSSDKLTHCGRFCFWLHCSWISRWPAGHASLVGVPFLLFFFVIYLDIFFSFFLLHKI